MTDTRVAVVGATGNIGTALVQALSRDDAVSEMRSFLGGLEAEAGIPTPPLAPPDSGVDVPPADSATPTTARRTETP